jgi:hypothetical protein
VKGLRPLPIAWLVASLKSGRPQPRVFTADEIAAMTPELRRAMCLPDPPGAAPRDVSR